MDSFTKQPYEQFTISMDFGANFAVGETISSQTVGVVDKNGNDVSLTVTNQVTVTHSGNLVKVLVRAGSKSASPYKITFRCVTSLSHQWEQEIQMIVREF